MDKWGCLRQGLGWARTGTVDVFFLDVLYQACVTIIMDANVHLLRKEKILFFKKECHLVRRMTQPPAAASPHALLSLPPRLRNLSSHFPHVPWAWQAAGMVLRETCGAEGAQTTQPQSAGWRDGPISQGGRPRHREMKWLNYRPTESSWWKWPQIDLVPKIDSSLPINQFWAQCAYPSLI